MIFPHQGIQLVLYFDSTVATAVGHDSVTRITSELFFENDLVPDHSTNRVDALQKPELVGLFAQGRVEAGERLQRVVDVEVVVHELHVVGVAVQGVQVVGTLHDRVHRTHGHRKKQLAAGRIESFAQVLNRRGVVEDVQQLGNCKP